MSNVNSEHKKEFVPYQLQSYKRFQATKTSNAYLGDNLLEVLLSPALCRVLHHGEGGVVVLLVLVVEEDELGPQVSLFGSAKNLRQSHIIER